MSHRAAHMEKCIFCLQRNLVSRKSGSESTQLDSGPDLWRVMSPGTGLLMGFLMGGNLCAAALIGVIFSLMKTSKNALG